LHTDLDCFGILLIGFWWVFFSLYTHC